MVQQKGTRGPNNSKNQIPRIQLASCTQTTLLMSVNSDYSCLSKSKLITLDFYLFPSKANGCIPEKLWHSFLCQNKVFHIKRLSKTKIPKFRSIIQVFQLNSSGHIGISPSILNKIIKSLILQPHGLKSEVSQIFVNQLVII